MAKGTRALSGAAKDAYLKRMLRAEGELQAPVRERLGERLKSEIASLTLRQAQLPEAATTAAAVGTEAVGFDPFSPNVVVVIRTRGREAVLAQLDGITDVASLRLLAREQQLGIEADLADAGAIRLAIVAAAERRIANRRAAAS